jgi:phosphatidate cytidylyltransferase
MLKQRILTALLLAPVVIVIILKGDELIFTLFTAFLATMIGYEWFQCVKKSPINSLVMSALVGISIIFINKASFIEIDVVRILIAACIIWLICFLWLFKPHEGNVKYAKKYALGVGVLLLFGASLISIHQLPEKGVQLTLVLFLLVWVADIGAYVSGKTFGKHKLAPQVSPGKTIEGLLGGLLFTAIYGFFVAQWLDYNTMYFIAIFPLIAVISVVGDLFASLLKRHNNIKDSGFLLPGHGGFLDRFDSLIAAAPFYFAFIHYIS